MPEMFDPPHPGSSLASALDALNLSAEQFASNLSVSSKSISQVIRGEDLNWLSSLLLLFPDLTLRCGSVCKRLTMIGKGSTTIPRNFRKPNILLMKSSSFLISVWDQYRLH